MRAPTSPLPVLLAFLGLLAPVAGCTDLGRMTSSFQRLVTTKVDDLSARRLLDDPVYFNDIRGPLSVDVISFSGSVRIEAVPELDHVTVHVERVATHGYGRKWEADDSLAEIDWSAEIVRNPVGPTLVIRTSTTHPEPHFQRVRIDITMPAADGVQIATRNGDVILDNVSGPIDLSTSNGNVRLMTPQPLVGPVSILNSYGDIDYRVRGESSGAFDCEAERGQVTHYTRYGQMVVDRATDHDSLKATLNGGENPVYLRTADGDIRVAVVADPTAVGVIIRN